MYKEQWRKMPYIQLHTCSGQKAATKVDEVLKLAQLRHR